MHLLLLDQMCARGAAAARFIAQHHLPVTVVDIENPLFAARNPHWEQQLRDGVQDYCQDDMMPAVLPVLMNDGKVILLGFTETTWSQYWHVPPVGAPVMAAKEMEKA